MTRSIAKIKIKMTLIDTGSNSLINVRDFLKNKRSLHFSYTLVMDVCSKMTKRDTHGSFTSVVKSRILRIEHTN